MSTPAKARPPSIDGPYSPELIRFLKRRMANPEDVKDAAQDTYRRYCDMDPGKRLENPKAYLLAIARNVCNDHFRRTRRAFVTVDSPSVESHMERTVDPWSNPPQSEQQFVQEVDGFLRDLPLSVRQVVQLAFSELLTNEEIADKTGLQLSTIEKYRLMGKKQLHDRLKEI